MVRCATFMVHTLVCDKAEVTTLGTGWTFNFNFAAYKRDWIEDSIFQATANHSDTTTTTTTVIVTIVVLMAASDPRTLEFASRVEGIDTPKKEDTRSGGDASTIFSDPFSKSPPESTAVADELRSSSGSPPEGSLSPPPQPRDRRLSKEWDAAKVPPSRFQKREGSIYATASSRDGHVKGKDRDSRFHALLKKKGWV
ncbi:hypothetical protein VTN00DRAFT_4295 [Thermoascus crustaceus]|uniref:uncharacterized protein n=1 Tax=Thermoascus crustaceus TaxID=5088 RepID=UPI0037424C9C